MFLSGILDTLHTQKSSLKYSLLSVTQCQLLTASFPGEQHNEKLFLCGLSVLHKGQPISRLFSSSCCSLKSIALSAAQVFGAVKVSGCKKARSGGRDRIFHLQKKSRQVVRHLNPLFRSEMSPVQEKKCFVFFLFQSYILKFFFPWLPLRIKLCGSGGLITKESTVWEDRASRSCAVSHRECW